MAQPTYVASGTAAAGASASSVAPGYPTLQADDILILQSFSGNDAAWTHDTPSGWTLISSVTNAGISAYFYWKRATGSESGTLTHTRSGGTGGLFYAIIHSFRGCIATGTPYEDATTNGVTTSTTPSTATIDTTDVDRLVCAFCSFAGDDAISSGYPPTGYTDRSNVSTATGSDGRMMLATIGQASAGTVTGVTLATIAAAQAWRTLALALIPASSSLSFTLDTVVVAVAAPVLGLKVSFPLDFAPVGLSAPDVAQKRSYPLDFASVIFSAPDMAFSTGSNLTFALDPVVIALAAPALGFKVSFPLDASLVALTAPDVAQKRSYPLDFATVGVTAPDAAQKRSYPLDFATVTVTAPDVAQKRTYQLPSALLGLTAPDVAQKRSYPLTAAQISVQVQDALTNLVATIWRVFWLPDVQLEAPVIDVLLQTVSEEVILQVVDSLMELE